MAQRWTSGPLAPRPAWPPCNECSTRSSFSKFAIHNMLPFGRFTGHCSWRTGLPAAPQSTCGRQKCRLAWPPCSEFLTPAPLSPAFRCATAAFGEQKLKHVSCSLSLCGKHTPLTGTVSSPHRKKPHELFLAHPTAVHQPLLVHSSAACKTYKIHCFCPAGQDAAEQRCMLIARAEFSDL